MSQAVSTSTLSLYLYPHGAELPPGLDLIVVPEATATFVLEEGHLHVHMSLPPRSHAEGRWLVDQLVRRVTALANVGEARICAADGVDDDLVVTLGLDMHQRTQGRVQIAERDDLQGRVVTVGALEDLCRLWVNEDPAERTSLAIARDVCDFAGAHKSVSVEVMAESALSAAGLRLILAVGGGSPASPPRLVIARYRPNGNEDAPLMLLGKGITFDSGGLNIKPYEAFVSMMKNDMAGSAVAFALFRGLVESGYKKPLLLVIPTCENTVDANAMRPGAVIESYRGLKVRVDHTDAEGRLV
ncbi:MAG: hypothetical protein GY778_06905, partial [bacterium]|nr:hypothetical protein [bacterium]